MKRPIVRVTDYRPPGAGSSPPLERQPARPGAAACPDRNAIVVADYSDDLLDAIIADLGNRNLRDYSNHETRWLAERASACRAERRRRKTERSAA